MENEYLDIKKELKIEAAFFLVVFVIIGVIFFISKFNMNRAQQKIDNFETLIIGNKYGGCDSRLLNTASERYTVTFIDSEMLNYMRTDSNYYMRNNELNFEPNTIYEDMTVPYEFRATPMGKIELVFEDHIYYIKFNVDGGIYIDYNSIPFSEQINIVLKEIFLFTNAFRETLF